MDQHSAATMRSDVVFPSDWIEASILENVLQEGCGPHESRLSEVRFIFPTGCKVMIDAAVRLLSLLNQLDQCCRRVTLEFVEGPSGTMGYLNRTGFFDHLSSNIIVEPARPTYSGAEMFGGGSNTLLEIARIHKGSRDTSLPTRLVEKLKQACRGRQDVNELEGAAWTIFAELIDNIFSHSQTPLDGYAALQVYKRGNSLKVAVSDSGQGIMETLRPSLETELPSLAKLSDRDLLVEVFRQGLSRHGADRGCGLKGSAEKAMKFNASLDVRLPKERVLLSPGQGGYGPDAAYCAEELPLIWGTHICFTFSLTTAV